MSNTNKNILELRFGRNIQGVRMCPDTWQLFQDEAIDLLKQFAIDAEADTYWTEIHTGKGEWINDIGVKESEESAVATLYWTEHGLHDSDERVEDAFASLEDAVVQLAYEYSQDAIAVVRGQSKLVS